MSEIEIEKCVLCREPLTLDNLLGEELGFCLNNYCSLEAGLTANELRAIRARIEEAERRGEKRAKIDAKEAFEAGFDHCCSRYQGTEEKRLEVFNQWRKEREAK